jgi:hypothetical protein
VSIFALGCNKQEEPPAAPQASEPANALSTQASEAIDTVKTTAKQVASETTAQVDAAQQQAQGIIDKAKAYIAEKKYQEALTSLNSLAGTKLTSGQQSLVDSLKAQIKTALAKATTTGTNAASALGNLLGGQK